MQTAKKKKVKTKKAPIKTVAKKFEKVLENLSRRDKAVRTKASPSPVRNKEYKNQKN